MSIKKHIPNFITILNLLCGCVAIVVAFEGKFVLSAYLIILATVLDYLDGMSARLLKTYSEIGKQLDSLADVISFGLAPGVVLFVLMSNNPDMPEVMVRNSDITPYLAFLIPVFSALRLAKFNIDSEQSLSFTGLPTPASALLIASLPLITARVGSTNESPFVEFANIINYPYSLIFLTLLVSYLLVSRLKLFSLKFKNLKWNDNKLRYILVLSSLVLFALIRCAALPLIIILYLILSVLFFRKKVPFSA